MEKGVNNSQKRKVLIFSVAYYPYLIGGAEVAVKEITDRINVDYEFDMVTLYAGEKRQEKIGNINVYRVGPKIDVKQGKSVKISHFVKIIYIFSAFIKALLLNRKRKYDFIWSIMASFSGFSALFFKYINKQTPFILTLQEGDSLEHIQKSFGITYPISRPLYKKIFAKADYIQAISKFLSDYAKDMGAVCNIEVIPNAVDFKLFSNPQQQGQIKALKSELGIKDEENILITTSRLVQKNAVGDIIDSMSFLPKNTKLLILGIGSQEDFLKEKVSLLKLQDRVVFAGFVPYKDIPLYLNISHVFIRPSLSEGFGNSFIEAMASGVPVIATRVGGIVDFLFDNQTGFFCEVKNPKSIADKVNEILSNQDLRDKVIENARKMVKEKYDWNIISRDIVDNVFNKIQ
jgi:glycosyltransferase involved in cell wall biosynthesis